MANFNSKQVLGSVAAGLSLAVLGAGCAGSSHESAVSAAIARLSSGQIVSQINEKQAQQGQQQGNALADLDLSLLSPRSLEKGRWAAQLNMLDDGIEKSVPAGSDPCPEVPVVQSTATVEEKRAAMSAFAGCMQRLSSRAFAMLRAFELYKMYSADPGAPSYADLTGDALADAILDEGAVHPLMLIGTNHPNLGRVRRGFTDTELTELRRLARERRAAFQEAETKIIQAAELRRPMITAFVTTDRWELLQAMMDTKADLTGQSLMSRIVRSPTLMVFSPASLQGFPADLLHPYALEAVVPGQHQEFSRLDPESENPFVVAGTKIFELGGSDAEVARMIRNFTMIRGLDNPAVQERAEATNAQAARIAVIDSGTDFVEYPDLGLFMGRGDRGVATEVANDDFSDADKNPWQIADGILSHGTGTMATVLTIAAHQYPELVAERRVEIAMWKNSTVRSFLAGSYQQNWRFDPNALFDLLMGMKNQVDAAERGEGTAPHAVSVSMAFGTHRFMNKDGYRDFLLRAPWLWVMAAGNSGVDLAEEKRTCFSDVPVELRRDDHILCIGALEKGIVQDKIASYSNFGERVDVYAYDSYTRLCPNGTSCSTPAITSAVAVLKAKFPSLTAAQLKQVIVASSEERELEVATRLTRPAILMPGAPSAATTRKVRVFDPSTMIERALATAAQVVDRGTHEDLGRVGNL